MKKRSRDLRKTLVDVRTKLNKVLTKDNHGVTKLKANFEAANTQLAELHFIRQEKFFGIARLQKALQQEETEAVQRRTELRNANMEQSNLRAKVSDLDKPTFEMAEKLKNARKER